jgi:hypothetical protein
MSASQPKFAGNFMSNRSFSFQPNKGQLADEHGKLLPDVLYYGKDKDISFYCFRDHIAFVFSKNMTAPTGNRLDKKVRAGDSMILARMEMQFVNANAAATVIAEDPQPEYYNYYLAHCTQGVTVNSYHKLTYKNIYPDIDLQLICKGHGLEYSFIVYPGGDANAIRMQWQGLDSLQQQEGSIRYANGLGYIKESGLKSYLSSGQPLNVTYGVQANGIAFRVPEYDKGQALTIDPTLIWGTYFGGSGDDEALATACDASGNVLLTGPLGSSGMATAGAFRTSMYNNFDIFIAKFSGNGKLLWSTYYGGNHGETSFGINVDANGNILVTGATTSDTGIATPGAYQTSLNDSYGENDCFLAKFSSNGSLIWSTYLGGKFEDYGYGVATDPSGNIFITGYTDGATNISTAGAFKTQSEGIDAFVAKFSPAGSCLWSTYYGGSGEDRARAIATSPDGSFYITGTTSSTSEIATPGAYQTSGNVFLTKFSSSGYPIWGTYYGENCDAYGVAVDASGNVIIAGSTNGTKNVASSGAYQTKYAGGYLDAFVAKFSSYGSRLWSTYYGGGNEDQGRGVATDRSENVYITGFTKSITGIATKGAYHVNGGGYNQDEFLAKFSPSGRLQWGTYYGGSADDYGMGICADAKGDAYICGYTLSADSMTTPGTFQPDFGGGETDGYLAKFYDTIPITDAGAIRASGIPVKPCAPEEQITAKIKNFGTSELDSVTVNWTVNHKLMPLYYWKGVLPSDSEADIVLSDSFVIQRGDTLTVWTSKPNGMKDSIPGNDTFRTVLYGPFPLAYTGPNHKLCIGDSVKIGGTPVKENTYSWTSKPRGFTSSSSNVMVKPKGTTVYYLTETISLTGCSRTDSVTVTVYPVPKPNAGPDRRICEKDSVLIGTKAIAGHSYHWLSVPPGFSSNDAMVYIGQKQAANTAATYVLTETIDSTGCSSTDVMRITVIPLPNVFAGRDTIVCANEPVLIGDPKNSSQYKYFWRSNPPGFHEHVSHDIYVSSDSSRTYYLTATDTLTGCSNTDSVVVTRRPLPTADAGKDTVICPGDSAHIGTSAIKGNSYRWYSIPKGFTSGTATATVKPDTTTVYYLSATSDTALCSKHDSVIVYVTKPSIGGMHDVCIGNSSLFTTPHHPGSAYSWSCRYGKISTDSTKDSVYISWSRSGTDTVTIKEFNKAGCNKPAKFAVHIHAQPSAAFSYKELNRQFIFTAEDATLSSYQWNFGDGTIGAGYSTEHTYTNDSVYKVRLTTKSPYGCVQQKDSLIKIYDTISTDFWYKIYPNPFNKELTVKYNLPDNERIQAVVYDERGRLIISLMDEQQPAGMHYFKLNGEAYSLASAVYYIRIIFGDRVVVAPVIRIGD